jgi:UDP-2-acetamido-3-amino-2,3-dideoxy-glucuronate N-acetyltransferase
MTRLFGDEGRQYTKFVFWSMQEKRVFVHESSIIDEGALIGEGTSIWHFCHIMATARVGRFCNIGQNVFVDRDVVIGDGVKIQNNVSLYKGVFVSDGVFIGPSVVFTNVLNPRSFVDRKASFKNTTIGKGASLGANATILCGIDIGSFAMVGAGAVVVSSVPTFALVVGNPAIQIGWVTETGISIHFNGAGEFFCAEENQVYAIENQVVYKK